jgi:divalent metal cation (Fe/Co/Zn/Cd) transporter
MELMDGNSHPEVYNALFEAVHSVEETGNPHRVRIRRIAGHWDIGMDIEVNPNCTVMEAHGIAYRVEQAIKNRIEGVYDIMIHVEPAENQEDECYGLREDSNQYCMQ